jgi:hypothetical protein
VIFLEAHEEHFKLETCASKAGPTTAIMHTCSINNTLNAAFAPARLCPSNLQSFGQQLVKPQVVREGPFSPAWPESHARPEYL